VCKKLGANREGLRKSLQRLSIYKGKKKKGKRGGPTVVNFGPSFASERRGGTWISRQTGEEGGKKRAPA